MLALPLFILGYQFGILNTYAALIFPFVVSPFGIFLFRQFFKTIPDDIVHAARLDGLSELADRLAHHGADGAAGGDRLLDLLRRRATGTTCSGR